MRIDKNFEDLTAMELYFLYLNEDKFVDALEDFSNMIGYGISEFIGCAFPSEYESWEEGYFGDKGVKFEVEPPAVDENKYEIVKNTDFIDFLEKMTHQYLVSFPLDESKVELLLNKIKTTLC
ncbi:ribonuclease toxin immunity protein CdiI [Paenibacillus azoreducens]|uniref:CDI immunity protein domain-containing protein n=1 Tax=Paenibacillus azoreducens TaxID=116718 RepID=A0A919YD73_9BACL|nr:ribonuclease toxin immunity protein CdiI [Paenibacillus azoreducens]GIO46910.1 hypothetical protein J34TS1_16750 [Paenibacillus azoreducens]